MGMDGYRPAQALSYTDPLGHLDAAARAHEVLKKKSAIAPEEALDGVGSDNRDPAEHEKREQKEKRQTLEEDLEEALELNYHLNLDPNVVYEFDYNNKADIIELKDTSTGQIVLKLPPEEFIRLTRSHRNFGLIADQSG